MEQRPEGLSASELQLAALVIAKKAARDMASEMAIEFAQLGELMCGICKKRATADAGLRNLARLSPREWEVLLLAVDGEGVKQMERLLGVSESAIKHYLATAFNKAGEGSRALATARYVEWRTLLGLSG